MKTFRIRSVVLAASLVFSAPGLRADAINLLSNGEFSSPSIAESATAADGYAEGTPTAWSFQGDAAQHGVSINGAMETGNPFFFCSLDGSRDNDLDQFLTAEYVQGNKYTLSFDYACGQSQEQGFTIRPFIAYDWGNTVLSDSYIPVAAKQGWTHSDISAIADAGVTGPIVIGFHFIAEQVGYSQVCLDNVTLTATTIPEPASLVVLVSGAASLLAYAWRRRR